MCRTKDKTLIREQFVHHLQTSPWILRTFEEFRRAAILLYLSRKFYKLVPFEEYPDQMEGASGLLDME